MKKLLSGIKPTGKLHIGNYFGAIKQWIDLQDEYECNFMVADYHSLNFIQNKEEMQDLIRDTVISYLAVGLNPDKAVIFKQSDIQAHTELAWIFDTITTMPYLQRAHAYKDAEAKGNEVSVGTFNYPMLMAADILLYDPDVVPVGQDQKQHVEYARDTAEKFNRIYGEAFKLPEALILEDVAVVPGTDGRKMSKSYRNTIPLFATREEIEKAVMSIVTDSTGDRPEHVYNIHKLFRSGADLENLYEEHKGKYKTLKEALIEDVDAFIAPLREKRALIEGKAKTSFAGSPDTSMEVSRGDKVVEVLMSGKEKAHTIAETKMEKVRKLVGVVL